jgi:hypothetical protein
MKYFSPDLFVRFCSNEDRIADQAQIEWERALKAYRTRLQRLRPEMPKGVQRLVDELRLHDAVLLHEASFRRHCLLSFRLDSPNNMVALLDYRITEPPISYVIELPAEARTESPIFLFDEIERARSDNGKAVFQHSILFGHGYLFVVRFHDVSISIGAETMPVGENHVIPAMARTA